MRKKAAAKKSSFGVDLIEGLNLVAAHQRGESGLEQVWPKPIDVKAIRKRVKMSQAEFSRAYGISKRLLDSLSKEIVIMHPGPINRGVELDSDAADSKQSIILHQVENGVAVRMAVLYLLAGGSTKP